MAEVKPKTLLGALKDDMKAPEQSLQAFGAEFKRLTPQDKADLTRWYEEQGQPIIAPPAA